MRRHLIETLIHIADKKNNAYFLTGDVGYAFVDAFEKAHPKKFFNMGVAEQNMIGVATGLALNNNLVFVYSMVPFITLRCLEQIRNDICHHSAPVCLIGVGGGLSYGTAGATHHACEDIALMRALPNMTVLVPSNAAQLRSMLFMFLQYKKPVYIRLGKDEVHLPDPPCFTFAKENIILEGKDIALVSYGEMLTCAAQVATLLKKESLSVRLVETPSIKPLPKNLLCNAFGEIKALFTIEDHNIDGGLGSAISELLAESEEKIIFRRFGITNRHRHITGDHAFLLRKNNLSAQEISSNILFLLKKRHYDKKRF